MLLVGIGWAAIQLQLDYVELTPGPAIAVGPMISLENPQNHLGSPLFLTAVYSDTNTNLAKLVQAEGADNAGTVTALQVEMV